MRTVEDHILYAQAINPKREPLTIEKLRTFPGCEHYTDEETAEIVQTLRQLATLLFDCKQNKTNHIDNQ